MVPEIGGRVFVCYEEHCDFVLTVAGRGKGGARGRENSDGERWVVFSCVRGEGFMQGGSCFCVLCVSLCRIKKQTYYFSKQGWGNTSGPYAPNPACGVLY